MMQPEQELYAAGRAAEAEAETQNSEQPEWMPKNPFPAIRKCADEDGVIQEYANESHNIFKAGCRQTARKIAEWGTVICLDAKHSGCISGYKRIRFDCPECMEQFQREVGL
jgi:hypothetical protein